MFVYKKVVAETFLKRNYPKSHVTEETAPQRGKRLSIALFHMLQMSESSMPIASALFYPNTFDKRGMCICNMKKCTLSVTAERQQRSGV